jgi:hypothetical protein
LARGNAIEGRGRPTSSRHPAPSVRRSTRMTGRSWRRCEFSKWSRQPRASLVGLIGSATDCRPELESQPDGRGAGRRAHRSALTDRIRSPNGWRDEARAAGRKRAGAEPRLESSADDVDCRRSSDECRHPRNALEGRHVSSGEAIRWTYVRSREESRRPPPESTRLAGQRERWARSASRITLASRSVSST